MTGKSDEGREVWRCEKCGREFGRKQSLGQHRCVQLSCSWCGKSVSRRPCEVAKGKRVFCSRDCSAKGHRGWSRLPKIEVNDKRCRRCGIIKGASEFTKCRASRDGLGVYCRECRAWRYAREREKRLMQGRAWKGAHKEQVREKMRAWRQAHKEEVREYKKARHRAHPEIERERRRRYRARNREELNGYQRKWIAENREKTVAGARRRRARKLAARGGATVEQVEGRVAIFGGRCYICGGPYEAIDHVKPLSAGGPDYAGNLRPICKRCNSVKRARWPVSIGELRQLVGVS